jgi:hypothetical protein
MQPQAITFPNNILEELKEQNLIKLEASIWSNFDSLIKDMQKIKTNVLYFANIFDNIIGTKSIYIEYSYLKGSEFINVIGYKLFEIDNVPDLVLDRISDLKENKLDFKKHKFKWNEK